MRRKKTKGIFTGSNIRYSIDENKYVKKKIKKKPYYIECNTRRCIEGWNSQPRNKMKSKKQKSSPKRDKFLQKNLQDYCR